MNKFEFKSENNTAFPVIPADTAVIGEYAFFGCDEIEIIEVPENVISIENGAFSGCKSLKKVELPIGLEEIGEGAFFGCSSLEELRIPYTVKKIGDFVLSSCISLKKVVIPAGCSNLGKGIFQGCSCLGSIETSGDGKYTGISGVLYENGRDGKILKMFPQGRGGQYETENDTVEIAAGAFLGCRLLEKVTISESVLTIGDRAFANCPDITIIIGNKDVEVGILPFEETAKVSVGSKKKNVFSKFDEPDFEAKLASIRFVMPVSKTFLVPEETWSHEDTEEGVEIVSYNGNDTEITTPNTLDDKPVTSIGRCAFSPEKGGIDLNRRKTLEKIRSVFLARSIKNIGTGAFKNCSSLEYVLVPNSVRTMGERAFSGCTNLNAVTLPQTVREISNGLFFGCRKLENIEIPEGTEKIGDLAFSGCERITFLAIPDGVKEIGRKAFANCKYLMYVTFPDTLEYVGMDAFKNTLWYSGRPEGVIYAGKCAVGYKGEAPMVQLELGTKAICPDCFAGNEWLNEISIPETVEKIGPESFWNCSKLRKAKIPASVKEIGERAFAGCKMLRNVNIPYGIEKINEFTFSGCSLLPSIEIPGSVKVIERAAFRACSTLNTVVIPDGVTTINDEAFIDCSALGQIFIPESVTEIGERIIAGCFNAQIRTPKDSAAWKYAELNHIKCVEC